MAYIPETNISPAGYCRDCSPELFPVRINQWKKDRIAVERGDIDYWVTLDGVMVSDDCIEAIRGTPGTVVLHERTNGHLGLCPKCAEQNRSNVAKVVKTGVVEFGALEV